MHLRLVKPIQTPSHAYLKGNRAYMYLFTLYPPDFGLAALKLAGGRELWFNFSA
jgi:hypothetical protein